MARSIYELIQAQAEGESLAADDTARLDEHFRKQRRVIIEMQAAGFVLGGFDNVRAWFLRDIDTQTAAELRRRIYWLVGLLEFGEGDIARQRGEFWRMRRGK